MNKSKTLFVYCKNSYTIDHISFDKGYIEPLNSGEIFFENQNWRYATDTEVSDYYSTPYSYRPNGRYIS